MNTKTLEALKAHHAAAMGAGLDMGHALSQLRVQAYKEGQLCRDTVAAIAAAEQAEPVAEIERVVKKLRYYGEVTPGCEENPTRKLMREAADMLAAQQQAEPVVFGDDVVQYISEYGGQCRDCADNLGVCQRTGLPCGEQDRAITHVLSALAYGINNGFLPRIAAQPPAVAVPDCKRNIGTLPVKDRYFLCHCDKCGWLGSSEECRESINHMYGDGDYYCPACGANGPDEMGSAEATFNAMLAAAPQDATEGCGACGDGGKGQGCRLERESPPTCQTCNGKGMIGGLLPNGGGYDGGPCPDCNTPQAAATVPKAPTWYKRSDIVKALERMNYHTAIADELADWFMRHMQLAFNRGFYQAHGPAAATQMEELELWHLLERATGELTRRAAPHAWEQIAWTAGAEFIEQRRARIAAAPQAAPLSAALADIAAERRRQIEQEGWTPEHDDAHRFGNMAFAAACYAIAGGNLAPGVQSETVAAIWPWTGWVWSWWKPKDKRRNLVKAGALIAAEIERIDRAAQKGGEA